MSVVRLGDGRLVVHNPMMLQPQAMEALEAWGTPSFVLIPNGGHRLDAAPFKQRYPEVQIFCPAGARAKVEQKVPVTGTYAHFPSFQELTVRELQGVAEREGVMLVRSHDGVSLVVCDVIFNLPHQRGPAGWLLRLLGSSGGPKLTAVGRMLLLKNGRALAGHLRQLADTPDLRRVIIMHGDNIVSDAPAVLRQVANAIHRD